MNYRTLGYPETFDSYDPDYDERPTDGCTCKRCGQDGLMWVHTGTRWRLVGDKGPHVCKATVDDFDIVKD